MRAGELNTFWRWGLVIVAPLVRLLFRVRVLGLEHIPSSGPAIVVFNHVSVLDGPVLAIEIARRLRRETRFLVAIEYFRRGPLGWVLRRSDQIPIRRGRGDAAALDEVIATVRGGALAALAPEGSVDEHAGAQGLQRIRSGVARIALTTGASVVPVGIWGTQDRWPRGGLSLARPLRPKLTLAFGPPMLPFGDAAEAADLDAFCDRVRTHLEQQVAEARRAGGPGS